MLNKSDIKKLSAEHKTALMHWHRNQDLDLPSFLKKLSVYELKAMIFLSLERPFDLCLFTGYSHLGLEELMNFPGYSSYSVAKKRGGKRTILKPHWRLLQLQRMLNAYLQAYYLCIKPAHVNGFVITPKETKKAANIVENAKAHVGKKHVLNIDLKDFFPNITARRVKQMFLSDLFDFNEQMATALALITTYQGSLPTGAPSSPMISNFVCYQLDHALIQFCEAHQLTYTRYADDLTFSSATKIPIDLLSKIKAIIHHHKFQVNDKKVRFQHAGQQQTVTGLVVNEKVNVNRQFLKRVRAMIHDLKTNGLESATIHHFDNNYAAASYTDLFLNRLSGYVEFIGQVRGKEDAVYLRMKGEFTSWLLRSEMVVDDGDNVSEEREGGSEEDLEQVDFKVHKTILWHEYGHVFGYVLIDKIFKDSRKILRIDLIANETPQIVPNIDNSFKEDNEQIEVIKAIIIFLMGAVFQVAIFKNRDKVCLRDFQDLFINAKYKLSTNNLFGHAGNDLHKIKAFIKQSNCFSNEQKLIEHDFLKIKKFAFDLYKIIYSHSLFETLEPHINSFDDKYNGKKSKDDDLCKIEKNVVKHLLHENFLNEIKMTIDEYFLY